MRIGERVLVDATEDKELVGPLGRIRFGVQNLKGFFKAALFAYRLD